MTFIKGLYIRKSERLIRSLITIASLFGTRNALSHPVCKSPYIYVLLFLPIHRCQIWGPVAYAHKRECIHVLRRVYCAAPVCVRSCVRMLPGPKSDTYITHLSIRYPRTKCTLMVSETTESRHCNFSIYYQFFEDIFYISSLVYR